MLKTIVPARLEYKDGVPYSTAYGDIYHSADGGAGQAQHVFLQGCGLPQGWADRSSFVILETGFGTGLNFLTTWAAWRDDPQRPARLHFLSVEKHPFRTADLARLHAQWPAFAGLSRELLANWPMLTPGFHRISLDGGRVQLTLMLGDAADCLPQLQAEVDAFYLDGFAPGVNADLWQPALFGELSRLAKPGALAATYTVAAPVRQGLTQAGFACEKRAGYGNKRHCLAACFAGESSRQGPALPQHVVVIGAGVAGAATAHALAQRGVTVTVLERADAIAQGASGNPVGVFRPLVSRDDNRASRLTRAAFLHDLRAWAALPGVEWSRCGVLHLAKDADAAAKQRQALADTAPPEDFARWVELDEARELANWPVAASGTFYPAAGWVVPASLCRAWLDHPMIRLQTGCAVARLQATSAGWQVLGDDDAMLVEADAVVLANARDALSLVPGQVWPLHTVRGQITQLPPGSLPEIARVIAREGYVAPGQERPLVGATYEHPKGHKHDDEDTAPRAASDLSNLARLEAILPGAGQRFAPDTVSGRASLRATLPDRLPLVGTVDGHPGLYVAAGYASRGVVWAGLLGEALADLMAGHPLPLEADLMRGIAPGRFARAWSIANFAVPDLIRTLAKTRRRTHSGAALKPLFRSKSGTTEAQSRSISGTTLVSEGVFHMSISRPAAVAGLFYPDDPIELKHTVADLLASASRGEPLRAIKALIVPHAGYVYSGLVAASAYARLAAQRDRIRRVVLLGPAHRVYVRGLALPEAERFATPLGDVELDLEGMQQLKDLPQVVKSAAAHQMEHSLEVQLPFLQQVLGEFQLLPLAVGEATPAEVAEVLERLWGGSETLIVISSDLSHFLPDAIARQVDGGTVDAILALDSHLNHEQACGATPINGLLLAARKHGLHPVMLDVCNSSDTAGDPERVVGYAAFAFESEEDTDQPEAEKGATLLKLARSEIASKLWEGAGKSFNAGWLQQPGASFVTLTRQGELRGCIGSLEAHRPLEIDVRENAVAAAFRDPRFTPLSRGEFDAVRVEVSLLSPSEPLEVEDEAAALAALRPHVDGVVFEYGHLRSTFLPQVWEQLPDPDQFLAYLKRKAGLPMDFWAEQVRLSRYTVTKWKEAAA